jgi:hypothetical protein
MIARILRYMLMAVALAATTGAEAAGVNAWLDRTQIAEGDTVQLTLEVHGRVDGQPDTTPLQADFDILGTSTGSRISIVNGRSDASTSWTLTLSPKHGGTLPIPALRIGADSSPALTLVVSNAPAPAAGSGADIFIETEVEPQRPYVQQQVLYTVRLLHAVPISGGRLSEPGPANALVQQLGDDREYTTTRGGRRYQVTERRYALFPQGSGRLELAAPVFDGEVPDSGHRGSNPRRQFFGNDPFFGHSLFDNLMAPTRRTRVRGEARTLNVQPRAAARGAHWLPAQQLSLSGTWQPDTTEFPAGEPVTLSLDISAKGLTGGQLPSLAPDAVDGFEIYPDQVQRQTDSDANGVTGHLHQKIAFIPRRTGRLTVPEIHLDWWDTQAGRERVVTLPGRVLQVAPAAGRSTTSAVPKPPPPAPDSSAPAPVPAPQTALPDTGAAPAPAVASGRWPWISAALVAVWLATLLLWWWRSRGTGSGPRAASPAPGTPLSGTAARKRFHAACASGDAAAARDALLDWAAAQWPDDPPRGLQALAKRLDDERARAALTGLDGALYKGDAWNGQTLSALLQQLPQPPRPDSRRDRELAPLYPRSDGSFG